VKSAACNCGQVTSRSRKTGPRFPLAVVSCSWHPQGRYTLYPPGHYPYGYEQLAPYSPSGQLLVDAITRQPPWEATLFAAAVDAAKGERRRSESRWFQPYDPRRRRTQDRRLELAGRLMGVHPALDRGVRERIATRLGVATMTLASATASWARSWKTRGAAIMAGTSGASPPSLPPGADAGSRCGKRLVGTSAALGCSSSELDHLACSDSRQAEHPGATTAEGRSPPPLCPARRCCATRCSPRSKHFCSPGGYPGRRCVRWPVECRSPNCSVHRHLHLGVRRKGRITAKLRLANAGELELSSGSQVQDSPGGGRCRACVQCAYSRLPLPAAPGLALRKCDSTWSTRSSS